LLLIKQATEDCLDAEEYLFFNPCGKKIKKRFFKKKKKKKKKELLEFIF